jgi:hypothetical protein
MEMAASSRCFARRAAGPLAITTRACVDHHPQRLARACSPPQSRARRRARRRQQQHHTANAVGEGGGGGGGTVPRRPAAANDAPKSANDTKADTPSPSSPTIALPIFLPPNTGRMPDVEQRERELLYLTDAEVEERVDSAAGLLSVLDDLRPLDRSAYSSSEQVWRAIADIPRTDRARLLDALEAGGCRQMWRHTVGRYALPRERAEALFRGYTVWRDLPPLPSYLEEEEEEEEEEKEEEEDVFEECEVEEEEEEEEEEEAMEDEEEEEAEKARQEAAARRRAEGDGGGRGQEGEGGGGGGGASSSRRRQSDPLLDHNDNNRDDNNHAYDESEVVEFDGICERLVVESVPLRATRPGDKNPIDLPPPSSAAADLRPRPGRALRRVRHFRLQVFRHARSGQPYARLVLPNALSSALTAEQADVGGAAGGEGAQGGGGGGGDWLARLAGAAVEGPSCYCRLDLGLALTPLRRDAGAELTLSWPSRDDPDLGGLTRYDLPESRQGRWPAPERWSDEWKQVRGSGGGGGRKGWLGRLLLGGAGGREEEERGAAAAAAAEGWSPFSWTDRDYVRPAGPGVYVGCGYRPTEGLMVEDQFVWFVLARRWKDEEEGEEEE